MSREVAARAFEPFFTTKAAGKGTGLGLATVYGIIAQAGGNVSIYSEPGLGTRVSIHLPAVNAPAAAGPSPIAAPQVAGGGATVLVVEDESAVLLAAARILTISGYKVMMRADPLDALTVLTDPAKHVDLLLTDVVMPDLSGVDLATRALELRPGLRIVYMTGYSREIVTQRGTLPAGSDMLQKPFTRNDLLEAIGAALARGTPD
jgi:CheY-like chemotaxis protein